MSKNSNQDKIDKSLEKRRAMYELEKELKTLKLWEKQDFNIMQDLALDIEATYAIKGAKLSLQKIVDEMKKEAVVRYKEYPELAEKIVAAIPSRQAVSQWRKTKKWNPAIWEKCKETGLFTKERKSMLINALFEKGLNGDVNAIKTYLTMSGDYAEKTEFKSDKTQDIFREINERLHKTKKDEF